MMHHFRVEAVPTSTGFILFLFNAMPVVEEENGPPCPFHSAAIGVHVGGFAHVAKTAESSQVRSSVT